MNREQKVALSLVVTTLAAAVASTVAILILYRRVGMPEALKGLAFMGISGLGCLSIFIFKKEKGKEPLTSVTSSYRKERRWQDLR
jgi:ABC-type maltose transport system permease subunit